MRDVPLLTAEQREVCECFVYDRNNGSILFLDVPGGTDKTFLQPYFSKPSIRR